MGRRAYSMPVMKGWSSHIATLLRVVLRSNGEVVELGAGAGSTPVLHWVCLAKGVHLTTYESVPFYHHFAKQYRSKNHTIRQVESWNLFEDVFAQHHQRVGVLFMDQGPAHVRGLNAIALRHAADYIVLHDTQPHTQKELDDYRRKNADFTGTDIYNYDIMWDWFPHRYTWKAGKPWTSVVSMTHDVQWLHDATWP